jgi:hypothetical protein
MFYWPNRGGFARHDALDRRAYATFHARFKEARRLVSLSLMSPRSCTNLFDRER